MILKLLISAIILCASQSALAFIELNAFYFSDNLQTSSANTSTNMFIEGSIGFAIDKKMNYLAGWNYSMHSITHSTTTSVKHSSTQMGPRFVWRIGKAQNWSLGVGYYLIAKATDNSSGSDVKWTGNAIKVDFGYSFDLSEDLQVGIRGNYSLATYNEQLANGTSYTAISYKRTETYPSTYLIWLW